MTTITAATNTGRPTADRIAAATATARPPPTADIAFKISTCLVSFTIHLEVCRLLRILGSSYSSYLLHRA